MKEILFIIGSPKIKSFNKLFSFYACDYLKTQAKITYLQYDHLPMMSPDNENPRPQEIEELLQIIHRVDGIWIFASEYNLGYTAGLKNLLDWISRPIQNNDFDLGTYVTGKKVTITSVAGKSGGSFVIDKLRELLTYIGMDVLERSTGVALNKKDFEEDIPHFTSQDLENLYLQADDFIKVI